MPPQTWLDPGQGRNLILMKVYFGEIANREALLEQVRERREDAERLRQELAELDAVPGARDNPFQSLARSFGFLYADALLRWTQEAERELGRAALKAPRARSAPAGGAAPKPVGRGRAGS